MHSWVESFFLFVNAGFEIKVLRSTGLMSFIEAFLYSNPGRLFFNLHLIVGDPLYFYVSTLPLSFLSHFHSALHHIRVRPVSLTG